MRDMVTTQRLDAMRWQIKAFERLKGNTVSAETATELAWKKLWELNRDQWITIAERFLEAVFGTIMNEVAAGREVNIRGWLGVRLGTRDGRKPEWRAGGTFSDIRGVKAMPRIYSKYLGW